MKVNYWGDCGKTVNTELSDHYKPTKARDYFWSCVSWICFGLFVMGAFAS